MPGRQLVHGIGEPHPLNVAADMLENQFEKARS